MPCLMVHASGVDRSTPLQFRLQSYCFFPIRTIPKYDDFAESSIICMLPVSQIASSSLCNIRYYLRFAYALGTLSLCFDYAPLLGQTHAWQMGGRRLCCWATRQNAHGERDTKKKRPREQGRFYRKKLGYNSNDEDSIFGIETAKKVQTASTVMRLQGRLHCAADPVRRLQSGR